jgi:hypothetical protein
MHSHGTWKRVGQNRNGVPYHEEAWEQVGVDWGNGTKPIVMWHRDAEHVVFKVPAGKHWSSLLEPSVSHPGNFVVGKIIDEGDGRIEVEELFEMPISARGRK